MNKKLQDLTWSILPKEFKEEVKRLYNLQLQKPDKHAWVWSCTYEDLFGNHNLTSDAEGEEMLIVPRSKVQELFDTGDKYSCSTLAALFGSKCLLDEKGVNIARLDKMLDETLKKETADSLNEWIDSREKQKPAEPKFKFKVGDTVRRTSDKTIHKIIFIDDKPTALPYQFENGTWSSEDYLELYTGPE